MSTNPIDVVQEFLAAMERLDYDAALPLVADECEYVNGPLPTVRGPEGVRSILEPFFAGTSENELRVRTLAVLGETVFVERLDRHHFPNGWAELPVVGVLEVRDGRITAWREYFDLRTIEEGVAATV